jgi:hypothetical protein
MGIALGYWFKYQFGLPGGYQVPGVYLGDGNDADR